ncbi:U2 snRNP-associated SURP motif-containing protein isoform X2 [Leguminivora glycinivorella]|uniref:U2 snRNP-associated SURP motif-containing protein isoform X2 n=1 Tax=Leguminivora glycinivorella TaxID=1035111 RepID=UPI00200C0344|nr:U2 snRNP-associated SURP motif-containing protein isoform X2 [Leguminivora glycinivorella]
MKKIPEQKLQAFSAGSMGSRNLSKKELEELRKKEEEEAAAHVFKEFVETFQEAPSTTSKVWVKAGTYDAGARKEDTSERGKLYKPTSRFEDKRPSAEEVVRSLAQRSSEQTRLRAKQSKDKKKSNLELFKEELRMIQEERSERHKYKNVLRERGAPVGAEPASLELLPDVGSYDTGDPNTTNLYLGNLNPKITEQQLMEIFGRYGPLASIKIMWPRSDEEKARGRNCGFVAFMSRRDGERALRCINGKEIMSYEMKLGWGKAVVIPPVPIYIPPSLQTPCQPPPPSGLPFNAQPPKHRANKIPRVRPGEYYPSDPDDRKAYEEILSQSIVKVVIPTERNILMLIHRMVEFVIREGPMFEAIIMNKEMNNPFFRFLFENQSPAHVYYRWKLFSMLQGDSPKQWTNNDFRMFKGGSVWRPPVMNLYTAGMPDELVDEDESKENIRGTLSNNQRDRLEELIRGLTPTRSAIGEAMAWCLEHAEAAGEVTQCLAESLTGEHTAPHKRVARLYLLSDILHNAQAKLTNASAFRSAIQSRLLEVMRDCHLAWSRMPSRLQQEGFRARVTRILQAWADWAVYPADLLLAASDAFRGRTTDKQVEMENIDGVSDGVGRLVARIRRLVVGGGAGPLDGAALRRLAAGRQPPAADIDGVPVEEDEDIDGVPLEVEKSRPVGGFIPSKWESVEPTDTWPEPAQPPPAPSISPIPPDTPTTISTANTSMSEELSLKRSVLRDIEVKVLKYADELEAGHRARRPGLTPQQQLQHYRRKLIKKASREAKEAVEETLESPSPRRRLSPEDDSYSTSSKKSKKSRDASLSPPVKRSRHSDRKSRSRSRDRERSGERREREHRRRRSPATPPSHHHRKHAKHSKYKY